MRNIAQIAKNLTYKS